MEQVRCCLAAHHAARRVRVRAHADFVLEAFQHGLDLLEQHGLAAPSWAQTEHAFVFDAAGHDFKGNAQERRQSLVGLLLLANQLVKKRLLFERLRV